MDLMPVSLCEVFGKEQQLLQYKRGGAAMDRPCHTKFFVEIAHF